MPTQDWGLSARKDTKETPRSRVLSILRGVGVAFALMLAGCASSPPQKTYPPAPKPQPPIVQAPKPIEEPQVIPLGDARVGRPERIPDRIPTPQSLPSPSTGITTLPGVQDGRGVPQPGVDSAPAAAGETPAPANLPSVSAPTNPVVVSMLSAADQYQQQGDLDRASSSVERGLRAAPHDAHLWQRLSRIRLQQGRYQQAEEMAKKSNSFAKGERALVAQNWLLIAESRQRMGDTSGASDARQRATSVSGGY